MRRSPRGSVDSNIKDRVRTGFINKASNVNFTKTNLRFSALLDIY